MIGLATRPRREQVPVVLPRVEVIVTGDDVESVTVDGEPATLTTPLHRGNLHAQMIELARMKGLPLDVRIVDDGRQVFVAVVTPEDGDGVGPSQDVAVGPNQTVIEGRPAVGVAAEDVAPPVTALVNQAANATTDPADPEPFHATDPDDVIVGLTGDGFLPGEYVAFAVIVSRAEANPDGTATLRLPAAVVGHKPGPFVLFGQTSGTLVLADPFGGDRR
jgi:hypothetical protein